MHEFNELATFVVICWLFGSTSNTNMIEKGVEDFMENIIYYACQLYSNRKVQNS